MILRRAPLAAVAVLLLTGACGSSDSGGDGGPPADAPSSSAGSPPAATSPEQAVSAMMAAIEKGDCDDVKAVVVTPDAIDCGSIRTLRGGYADEGIDLDDVGLAVGEQSGDSATVTADLGDGADPETWQVERVDAAWKVLFDSEE